VFGWQKKFKAAFKLHKHRPREWINGKRGVKEATVLKFERWCSTFGYVPEVQMPVFSQSFADELRSTLDLRQKE